MDGKTLMTIADHIIDDYPDVRQAYTYDCGASAVQSVLAYYGNNVREDVIMQALGTTPEDGTNTADIVRFLKEEKFDIKSGTMTLDTLKTFIDMDYPVILAIQAYRDDECINYRNDYEDGHYVVAVGYDDDQVFFEDPSSFNKTYLTYQELEDRWHDADGMKKYEHFGIVVVGKRDKMNSRKIEHLD